MKRTPRVLVGALFLISINAAAADDTPNTPDWKQVGSWDIRVDTTLNNGCFMVAAYKTGDVLRIGFNRQNSNGYLIFGNEAWKSLKVGEKYSIEIKFGAETPWNGAATGIDLGGTMLMLNFTDQAMMKELANSPNLLMKYNGQQVFNLELAGSREAVDELIKCQNAVDIRSPKAATPKSDPFSTPARNSSSDPFSR